jgi:chromate reductase
MKKILIFTGSSSSQSINRKLLRYAGSLVKNHRVDEIDLRDYPLPVYGPDLEKEIGVPENARKLKDLFSQYDGFIIATPEYNGSLPAFFKNALEWASRDNRQMFAGKSLLLLATAPGPGGGRYVLKTAERIFTYNFGGHVSGTFFLPRFWDEVEANGDEIKIAKVPLDHELQLQVAQLETSLMAVPTPS